MTPCRSVLVVLLCLAVGLLSACIELSRQRVVYDKDRIEIGIEHDPSTDRVSKPVANSHPADLTEADVRRLLAVFQVGGYTGTLGGLVASPRPFRAFKDEELRLIASPIATALRKAGPADRVYFAVPNFDVRYSDDRTTGALFLRGPYLYLMLRDHSALVRTDTGGADDDKDPRDTKGMRLSVLPPARIATLAPEDEPRWNTLEKIHTQVNVNEVLYGEKVAAPARDVRPAAQAQPAPPPKSEPQTVPDKAAADLQLQIRELTNANLELRDRLKDQAEQMKALQEEMERLKLDLRKPSVKKSQPKPKSSPPAQ